MVMIFVIIELTVTWIQIHCLSKMSNLSECPSVVFDVGSAYFKAGFSGDCFPRAVFSSVVGRYIYITLLRTLNKEYVYKILI